MLVSELIYQILTVVFKLVKYIGWKLLADRIQIRFSIAHKTSAAWSQPLNCSFHMPCILLDSVQKGTLPMLTSFAQNGLPQILPFSLSKCLSSSREQPPIARPPIPLCPLFPSCLSQLHTGQFLDWFLPSAVLFQTDWKEICLPMELWFCSYFHFLNFYWNIVDL